MALFRLSPAEVTALFLSLKVSIWCVIITLPGGIFFGWLLARKNFKGKSLLDSLLHLPLVLPPVVTGYLLLICLGQQGFIGKLLFMLSGSSVVFHWTGAVLASATVGFPLMVRAIRLGIEAVDPKLEEAAKSLGASPLRVIWTITLPLALPAIFTGALLSFARSLGEFGATITFVGNIQGTTRTLPLAIFTALQVPGREMQAARLTIISILLAFLALFFSEQISARAKENTRK